jgi:hypothetical protein
VTLLSAATSSQASTANLVITGLVGVAGALAGAALTGFFARRAERDRQHFARETEKNRQDYEEAQRTRRAKGAVRHWRELFGGAIDLYATLLTQGTWWPPPLAPQLFPDLPERREVISLLTDQERKDVVHAETQMRLLLAQRPGPEHRFPPLTDTDRALLAQAKTSVELGDQALTRLSE